MKKPQVIVFILLAIVAFGIASVTITVLHHLIGIPQGAALGVGIAFAVFACIASLKFFEGIF
jgi:hypothetical protein